MPNKNYLAGRRFEYETMKAMKNLGYKVIRASGSHGEFDVIGYSEGRRPLFVQCKVCKTKSEGQLLLKKFEEATTPSKYYKQIMSVKVGRGMVNLMEVTI